MPAYAIGFFITIILRSMGYSTLMSLVLTCPPYFFAVSRSHPIRSLHTKHFHRPSVPSSSLSFLIGPESVLSGSVCKTLLFLLVSSLLAIRTTTVPDTLDFSSSMLVPLAAFPEFSPTLVSKFLT